MLLFLVWSCADPGAPLTGTAIEVGASDPVWDPRALPVFRLSLDAAWEARLAELIPGEDDDECAPRETIPGSLVYENPQSGESESYEVTVRYRGHSALKGDGRFGFKIAFDAADSEARFHDLKRVNLLGTEGDDSLLRERLAQSLMGTAGVPAPRVNHARLYINEEFQGIFPNSEEADDQSFLDAHFVDASGHLYKSEGYCGGAGDFADEGGDWEDYEEKYDAHAGTDPDDVLEDLIPFVQCVNDSTDAKLAECMATYTDLDEWLAEMAVDAVLPDVDGLAGAGQNFMLYADPSTARFVVYSWDKDQAFYTDSLNEGNTIFNFYPTWRDEAPKLAVRLRSVWREDYCSTIESLLDDYEALATQATDLEGFLAPYIADDPYFTDKAWASHVQSIRDAIALRGPEVAAQAEECDPG